MFKPEMPFWANEYFLTENCPKCGVETFVNYINKYATEKWCLNCRNFAYSWLDCCNNSDPIKVIYYMKDGRPSVREQCLNCGRLLNSKATSFKSVDQESLRYFDESAKLNRDAEIDILKKDFEKKRKFNFSLRYQKGYIEYLKSDKWKNLRLKILERDNNLCQKCKTNQACHVHHLTYERLGRENLEDLISICLDCHTQEHPDKLWHLG
jgi:5-methylcytosine-specific restriction endonuclease McrA